MNNTSKAGASVRVFEDPYTREKEEGTATLVDFLGVEECGRHTLEYWTVDFGDGYGPLRRYVHPDDISVK